MALQTSVNRRSSLRSSSDRRPGSFRSASSSWNRVDGLLERIALDEPHRVVRTAVGVGAQAVDGDDAGVLEPAGDLGLGDEPLPADGVVGVLLEDLLERHLAVQLAVERHEDGAQAASGMRPEDAEPLSVGGGRADGIGAGAVGVVVFGVGGRAVVAPSDQCECGLDLRLAERGQAGASGPVRRYRGQALLDVAVLLDDAGRRGPPAGRAGQR